MSKNPRDPVMKAAIAAAGGATVVAAALRIKYENAIYQWRRVPASRVTALSELSGFPPEKLRPDIFGPPALPKSTVSAAKGRVQALKSGRRGISSQSVRE